MRSECRYRCGELDVGLVVPGFVLLVFVDVHLPDNPGIINRQLFPQIVFLFSFVPLLGSLVFPVINWLVIKLLFRVDYRFIEGIEMNHFLIKCRLFLSILEVGKNNSSTLNI